jgi:hypothetical protein
MLTKNLTARMYRHHLLKSESTPVHVFKTLEETLQGQNNHHRVSGALGFKNKLILSSCRTTENAARQRTVSNRAGNAQLDLSAGPNAAPNCDLRADLSAAFAHSWQAIMARATLHQHRWFNAPSVIPNAHTEQTFCVNEFRFNMPRPEVGESIS